MENKKRESTLEVLKRLQSQNKRELGFGSDFAVKKTAGEILGLEEDKISKIVPTKKYSEGIIILNNIREIESRLKRGNNYFDHYYDLRKNEDKLLKFYNSFEDKESLPVELKSKARDIEKRLRKIQ